MWATLIPAAASLVGGAISSRKNKGAVDKARALDKETINQYYDYARPNMTNASGATQEWHRDPATGKVTGRQSFGPEEQARRDQFNQMAGNRMGMAAGIPMDRYKNSMTFANNPRLQGYQANAGGPRQNSQPFTPAPRAPLPALGGAAVGGAAPPPVSAGLPAGLEGLTPEEVQQLLVLLRQKGASGTGGQGGDNGSGMGGNGGNDGMGNTGNSDGFGGSGGGDW